MQRRPARQNYFTEEDPLLENDNEDVEDDADEEAPQRNGGQEPKGSEEDDDDEAEDWLDAGDAKTGVFNLLSATLGAGQLMQPFAFAKAGLLPGIGLLLLGAVATTLSFRMIVLCASEHGATSLEHLARQAFGPRMEWVVAVGVVLFSISAAVMYLTRAAELLMEGFENSFSLQTLMCSYGVLCFLMALPKQMVSIRVISICSILSVLYLVGLTVGHCVYEVHQHGGLGPYLYRKDVNLVFGSPLGVFQAFPMMVYAFAAQIAVPAILEGMNQEYKFKKRTRRLLDRRRGLARALALTRAISDSPETTTELEDFLDADLEERGIEPSIPRAESMVGLSSGTHPLIKPRLSRRPSVKDRLSQGPLETMTAEEFTSLHKRKRSFVSLSQIDALSTLPLEKMSEAELDALSDIPFERYSVAKMQLAAADPIDAWRSERSRRDRGPKKPTDRAGPRMLLAKRRMESETQENTLQRLMQTFNHITKFGTSEDAPTKRLTMSFAMKVHSFEYVAATALFFCVAVDLAIGFFGALEFGAAAKPNVLNNFSLRYDVDSVWMMLAYISFLFHISTMFPLILFPCRIVVLSAIFGHDEDSFIVDMEQCIFAGTLSEKEELAVAWRIFRYHRVSEFSTGVFVAICVIIALRVVPNVAMVFELTRGFAFALVCFIFPGMATIHMHVQDSKRDSLSAVFLIVVGLVAGSLWTWSAILDNGLIRHHPLT